MASHLHDLSDPNPSIPDPMEPGDSSHSLPSERRSEMGSSYVMESGVYMSSFAATIFIAALVTIGVLVLTLLVALTIMLESCENRNSGVFEQAKSSDIDGYCSIFAFHAELNNLGADNFPATCKLHSLKYIKEGRYLQDLNMTLQVVQNYFGTVTPDVDGYDVILVDVDDLLLSDIMYSNCSVQRWGGHAEEVKHLARSLILSLHMELQNLGWNLIPFTRTYMKQVEPIIDSLKAAGYSGYASLIMRSVEELATENWRYISERRVHLHNQGFRIAGVISSQMDALIGPCPGKRNFKLAHPIYYNAEWQRLPR